VDARIALTGLAPPFRGGIAHYTLHLGSALSNLGRARLFSWARQYPDLLFPGTTQHDTSLLGLPVETVRILDPMSPWTWIEAARLMRDYGADRLVHQWWHPWFAPATWSLLRMTAALGIRSTVVCHNLLPHEPVAAAQAAVRTALAPADRIIVHGRSEAETARSWWPRTEVAAHPHPPYHVLAGPSLGRREARSRLGLPSDGPLVLFFGYVRAYKGLGDLVEAMATVARSVPAARLAAAGEFYEPVEEYEEQIGRLGLGRRVLLRDGYVPNAEVGLWLRAADLVALPYREATGSGILPLARAAGVPVVSTRVGDLPDLMQEGRDGLLVPPRDAAKLARAIVRLLRRPPDRSAIKDAARGQGWSSLARTAAAPG
jgi:glycosyltransferase involved in cell wall biosynthesis